VERTDDKRILREQNSTDFDEEWMLGDLKQIDQIASETQYRL
jgi:hypothetical protein